MKQITTLLLLLALTSSWSWAHEQHSSKVTTDQINVTGVGQVEAEPDQAVLSVSIVVAKLSLLEAKQQSDEKYQQVLGVIAKAGIAKKQYKVTSLNSYPQYDWSNNTRQYKGQEITRLLSITINDLDKVSPLIQALIENGISTISSVDFGFQDKSALQRQALASAIDDASSKAAFIAAKFNRDLGGVLNVSERNIQVPTFQSHSYQREEIAVGASFNGLSAPAEALGTQKVQANINVSFKLK